MKNFQLTNFTKAIITGLLLAFLTYIFFYTLEDEKIIELLTVIMTLIGAAYYGFAFKEDNRSIVITEVVVSTLFIVTALLGLWFSIWFIFVGLVLHGFWDLIHHNSKKLARIPSWYIPFCVVYDWVLAVIVLFVILL